ncbi:hypothetical protein Fcan01_12424 [Folsomia candida]|uniref:Uncharacterized protein n=1 Tax=Folsomia candida TaxID=158441 RepID=A0A226E4H8_FOLCA|nr:hypothetical protein Fcan01_12424 [Folsomia candida]
MAEPSWRLNWMDEQQQQQVQTESRGRTLIAVVVVVFPSINTHISSPPCSTGYYYFVHGMVVADGMQEEEEVSKRNNFLPSIKGERVREGWGNKKQFCPHSVILSSVLPRQCELLTFKPVTTLLYPRTNSHLPLSVCGHAPMKNLFITSFHAERSQAKYQNVEDKHLCWEESGESFGGRNCVEKVDLASSSLFTRMHPNVGITP